MCIQENGHKTAVFALCDKATIAIDPTITGAVLCRGLQILGGIGFGHRGYFTKVEAQKGAIGIIPKDKIAGGKGGFRRKAAFRSGPRFIKAAGG